MKRVASRWNHSTSMPAMPARAQAGAKAGRHRAEILADHDRAVAMRFQRQQPQQVVERIGEIGALATPSAPCGTSHSRIRPMAWSMRTPPAWRSAARKVAMNGSKPLRDQRLRREAR